MQLLRIIVGFFILIFLNSCEKNPKKNINYLKVPLQNDSMAQTLFEQKCQVCHNLGTTEAEIIAPPFFAVRKQYLQFSMDKNDFIETMTDFVKKPDAEKSLMKPAVEQFKVMPYQPFKEEEIALIVEYIYRTEMPKPSWFDSHETLHRKGIKH
jgi:hypothetical protein